MNISKGECCGLCINLGKKGERTGCTNMNCFCHQEPVGEQWFDKICHCRKFKQNGFCMHRPASKEPSWDWKDKIRKDYAGIISETQIETTIAYWERFISRVRQEAFEEGKRESAEIIETLKSVIEGHTQLVPTWLKEGRKEALTSLLAQIPEEKKRKSWSDVDYVDGFNEALATIRELINKQINN